MPTSLFDMDRNSSGGSTNGLSSGLEDQRALQLALELSMMGLNPGGDMDDPNSAFDLEGRHKKGQNMTECVPVPSSEHVAEIVGRQGCKIKALRTKTNTYIKTPVRGEEPVFVVTGRKEDVTEAKREILSAAEHFSQIRASRKTNMNGSLAPGPPAIPGQTTIQVRVPYRVVGLVVGPKGATIKRIQQQTHTYIVTPSRDKEPIFEVTGLPENVECAKKEIEAHIAIRTGNLLDSFGDQGYGSSDMSLTNLYKSLNFDPASNNSNGFLKDNMLTSFSSSSKFGQFGMYDADEGISESPTFESSLGTSLWTDFSGGLSKGGASSNLFNDQRRSASLSGPSGRISPMSGLPEGLLDGAIDHPPARRMRSDPMGVLTSSTGAFGSNSGGSAASSPTDSVNSGSVSRPKKKDCVVCFESEVVAALIPCGHNFFCLECANRICDRPQPECPSCQQPVIQAVRIYS